MMYIEQLPDVVEVHWGVTTRSSIAQLFSFTIFILFSLPAKKQNKKTTTLFSLIAITGPHSAVGNVSDYRCVSECRARGLEFDPGSVTYFSKNIEHEKISMVILLLSADSFKKGCCQLQAKVCARSTG